MKYAIITSFFLVYCLLGTELGYSTTSPTYTIFTYQFQHASWMHLILNSIAFFSFYKALQKAIPQPIIFLAAYLLSIIAAICSCYSQPTVGASGMIYVMAGMFLSICFIGKKLHIVDKRKFVLFVSCLAISITISFFKPSVNTACHLWALALGLLAGFIDNKLNPCK